MSFRIAPLILAMALLPGVWAVAQESFRMATYPPDMESPPLRTRDEVAMLLAGNDNGPSNTAPLRIVLVAGEKDHKAGEHDYPAWQKVWSRLLAKTPDTIVEVAWEFPSERQIESVDVLVFYQRGRWDKSRAAAIDPFLARGGGLVYVHMAIDGREEHSEMAKRIGLASYGGHIGYRHGDLNVDFSPAQSHPIARNFQRIRWCDESYWKLTGDRSRINILATCSEDGHPQPQFWTVERGRGRVFVSIPGHYMWTFDDPAFRVLLLRGIAWTGRHSVDRFNELVTLDARIE